MNPKVLEYKVGDLPAAWPGVRTITPRKAPFKSTQTRAVLVAFHGGVAL